MVDGEVRLETLLGSEPFYGIDEALGMIAELRRRNAVVALAGPKRRAPLSDLATPRPNLRLVRG